MLSVQEMKQFIIAKTRNNAARFGDRLPSATISGRYRFVEDGTWVGGFWTGLNHLCYEWTGEASFLEVARKSRGRFRRRLYESPDTLDHDIGFLFTLSAVADFKVTGDAEALKMALDAAYALRGRFRERGKFVQAWNVWDPGEPFSEENRGRIIVDSLYNMPLLLWAGRETGDPALLEAACAHLDTCARTLIRDDFSAYHTYVFDPDTGKPLYGRTFQGYADESCWSRGQAWAIGGYTYGYMYTGDRGYLALAESCADLFIALTPEDDVPPWDFRVPYPAAEPIDSSAAAIAASGLLELSRHVQSDRARRYRVFAERQLRILFERYATRELPDEEGLLLHACGHRPLGEDIDCSLIYGDYFFAEAVGRLGDGYTTYW